MFLYLLLFSIAFALECKNNKDCVTLKTVCQPSFYCDSKRTKQCQSLKRSELCTNEKEGARLFNQNWSHHGNIGIQCIIASRQCVIVYYCTEDSECDDKLYCNGKERCISGHCERNSNFSFICQQCNETDRCGSYNVTESDQTPTSEPTVVLLSETTIIVILSIFTVIAFVAVIVLLYWLFRRKAKMNKKVLI